MDTSYELYCLVDPIFYDSPAARRSQEAAGCTVAERPVPDGWQRSSVEPLPAWSQ